MVKQNGLTLIALDYLEFHQDFLCRAILFLHEFYTVRIVPIKMKFQLIYNKTLHDGESDERSSLTSKTIRTMHTNAHIHTTARFLSISLACLAVSVLVYVCVPVHVDCTDEYERKQKREKHARYNYTHTKVDTSTLAH